MHGCQEVSVYQNIISVVEVLGLVVVIGTNSALDSSSIIFIEKEQPLLHSEALAGRVRCIPGSLILALERVHGKVQEAQATGDSVAA